MLSVSRPATRSSAKSPRFSKRYQRLDDLPVVHRHAAGIDLAGAASHFVAVELGDEVEVREFGGTTAEVHELVAYLCTHGVTTVAMEATGVYWMVVYDLLELAGLEVYLVNPTHAKNVPGRRKDDKQDCRWLQKLHKYGLLSASFRPDPEDRPLQQLYRQRTRLIQLSADELRRMQKALDVMNVRLHKAVSALSGKTGLRIVRAIAAGEQDPAVLARMRDPRCACTEEELRAALTGHYLPHQVRALRRALIRYDLLAAQIIEIDTEMEAELQLLLPPGTVVPSAPAAAETAPAAAPLAGAAAPALPSPARPAPAPASHGHAPAFDVVAYFLALLQVDPTQLPGIGPATALGLLAELGRDMTKWPTVKHFTSYLTLAPQPKISGGKVLSSRTRPGTHPAAVLFRQAATGVIQTETALGACYRRLAVRMKGGKALTATARKLAEQYYYLLRHGRAYVEAGAAAAEARYRQHQITAVTKRAKKLGLQVLPAG